MAVAAAALVTAITFNCAIAASYEAIKIEAPGNEETIHSNDGNVEVRANVTPKLDAAGGDRLELLLDGAPRESGTTGTFMLRGVSRGTHSVQVRVLTANGVVLLVSAPTLFHMWQASRLFPNRQ